MSLRPSLNLTTVGLGLAILTVLTIYRAYHIHRQFFTTCIYLMKSGLSKLVYHTKYVNILLTILTVGLSIFWYLFDDPLYKYPTYSPVWRTQAR